MAARKAEVIYVGDAASLVRASREASAAVGRTHGEVEKLAAKTEKSFSRIRSAAGSLAAIGGISALAFGLKDVTGEAVKAEAEQKKLANTVKDAGLSWHAHSKEIEQWLDKTSRASGFAKSELTASFGNMVRTTGSLTKAQHLNGLAMDVARSKGVSLAGAQSLIARTYNGSFVGLKRLGIAITPVTKNQDALKASTKKATDEQKRHAKQLDQVATRTAALGLVQKKFGGQSKAYASSTAGAFDRAKASLQLVEEKVGKIVLPLMAKAANAIAALADSAEKHWPQIKAIADQVFGRVKAVLAPVITAIGHALPTAFAIAKGALVDTVKAVTSIVNGFKQGKVWAVALVGALGGLAAGILAVKVVTLAVAGATKAYAVAQGILNAVMALNPLVAIGVAIAVVIGALVALELKTHFVEKAWKALKVAFKAVTDWIGGAASKAFDLVKRAASIGLLGPVPLIISHWQTVVSFFKALPGRIVNFFYHLPGKLLQVGMNIVTGLANGIKNGAGAVYDAFKSIAKKGVDLLTHPWKILSPSRVFFDIGNFVGEGLAQGIEHSRARIDAAVNSSLLYPLDQAIDKLNAAKAKLQATYDAIDARAQRSSLVAAVASARAGGSSSSGSGGSGGGTSSPAFRSHGGSAGFFPSSGANYSHGVEPQIAARLDALGKALGIKLTGLSGYRTPAHSVAVGGFANDPHTRGQASDTPGVERVAESVLRKFGLTRPFGGAKEADHIQLLPGFRARASSGGGGGGAVTKSSFARSVLAGLGIKATGANLKALVGWENAEGGNWNNSAHFNPLNTTLGMSGASSINSVGVKSYKSWSQGLAATLKTLKGSAYASIRKALMGGSPSAIASAIGRSPWGTSSSLVASAIAGAHVSGGGGGINAPDFTGQINRNEDRIAALRQKARNLPSGKGSTAARKQIANEIAALNERDRKLRSAESGDKAAAAKQSKIQAAIKALKDFDKAAARAKKLATIDIKVANLEKLKAFRDAIAGIKSQVHDLASQAAQAWRAIQEKGINATHDAAIAAINGGADAQELAGLQAKDAAEQDAKTTAQLNQDLADAIASGDKKAQQDAQDAIQDYARQKREQELSDNIANAQKKADDAQQTALDGLDQQTADYEAGLDAQLDVLNTSLEKRKISYATWAKDVNGILAGYGLSVATSSGDESAIQAVGPAPVTSGTGTFSYQLPGSGFGWGGHRASGGSVRAGMSYTVGEVGPERFTPAVDGRIDSASRSRGGNGPLVHVENMNVRSSREVVLAAERLAHKIAYGGRGVAIA